MKETKYYKLHKPEEFEYFDIGDFNGNSDKIDEILHGFQDLLDEMSAEVVEEQIEKLGILLEETKELAEKSVHTVNGKSGNEVELDYSDVGAVPEGRNVNGHALTGDITLTQWDIGIEADLPGMEKDIAKAQAAADRAQFSADTAQLAAEKAQSTGDAAKSAAGNAQSTADTAKTAAATAQSTADAAQSAASGAQTTANTANTTAKNAMPKAGGSFTGKVVAGGTLAEGTSQMRNIVIVASSVNPATLNVPAGTIILVKE